MADNEKQKREAEEVNQRSAPSEKVVYRTILEEGRKELERPFPAVFWSALAAGLSMGFSFIAEALLHHLVPDVQWKPLVTKFGYSVGFLIVILGRQQLFTENTITPVLPLLLDKKLKDVASVARIWLLVLVGNLVGAFLMALLCVKTTAFEPSLHATFRELGMKAIEPGFGTLFIRAIFAGWLIALMVWLLPFAESARIWVIIIITYLVGVAHFSHIVAGAIEVFALALEGGTEWREVFLRFIPATLMGNVLGGITLVAALNHAQVVAGRNGESIE